MSVGDVDITKRGDIDQLKPNAVGLYSILFLCVTGSAPLAVTLFNTPYVGPQGSGYGGPGAFIFATIVLMIFSVAYVQMCLKVRAAGGMYTFVSHGLGRVMGMMSGFSLMIAYTLFGASLIGGFATFTQNTLNAHLGIHGIPWIYLALGAVVVVFILGYFDVEVSVKILGVALIGELIVILIFTIVVLARGGRDGIQLAPINPVNGLTKGLAPGIGVFFAFWSWVGFEAAPNYAEESRDPVRTIPIAVYFSCLGVGALYSLMMWAVTTAYGSGDAISTALNDAKPITLNGYTFVPDPVKSFVTGPMHAYVGSFFASAMDWLIVTGSLACASALTNAGLRYWYAMGREGIMPRALGRTHPKHKTPHVAITVVAIINAVICLLFWGFNHTSYEMYGWTSVQGVIWIVLVQAFAALSTFFYFKREHPTEMHWWKTIAAPWIGFGAQIFVLLLCYHNLYFLASQSGNVYVGRRFELFSGWAALQFNLLGIIGVLVPLIGAGIALYYRTADPAKYEVLGRFVNEGAV